MSKIISFSDFSNSLIYDVVLTHKKGDDFSKVEETADEILAQIDLETFFDTHGKLFTCLFFRWLLWVPC
jgi:hypothetical protein